MGALKMLKDLLDIESDFKGEKWTKENFEKGLPWKWNLSFQASISGKIIGFCVASKRGDAVHIHRFMVHRDYRGKGLGTAMMQEIVNRTKKAGSIKITLKVQNFNFEAIEFYHKIGFKK